MRIEDKKNNAVNRLLKLQQAVIEKFNDSIKYEDGDDKNIVLIDAIFDHLTTGELNENYETEVLKGLNDEEKSELLNTVNSYKDVLFYDGDPMCWAESSERFIEDFTMVATEVLDNYDFLIKLYKVGGTKALDLLRELRDQPGYSDYSVIERLRATFGNDELLERVLLEMTKDNNLYKIFTLPEKAELLDFPLGLLYFNKDENTAIVTNPLELALELYNRDVFEDEKLDSSNIEEVVGKVTEYLRDNDFAFSSNVAELFFDYEDNNPIYYASKIDNIEVDKKGNKTRELFDKEEKEMVR